MPAIPTGLKCDSDSLLEIPSNPHHFVRHIHLCSIKILHLLYDFVKEDSEVLFTALHPGEVLLANPGMEVGLYVEMVKKHAVTKLVNFETLQVYCNYFSFLYQHALHSIAAFCSRKTAPGLAKREDQWLEYREFLMKCSFFLYYTIQRKLKMCHFYEVNEFPGKKWNTIARENLTKDGYARVNVIVDFENIDQAIRDKYNTSSSTVFKTIFQSQNLLCFNQVEDAFDTLMDQVKEQILLYSD